MAASLELYFGFVNEAATPETLDTCRGWLSEEERVRADRFYFERDRTLYTLGHALVRKVLGERLGVEGRTLSFSTGAHGRPEVHARHGATVSFNLSHTPGLVLLGVAAAGTEVGVDTELENPARAGMDVASRSFSATELARLVALPEAERMRRFFTLWTLKEAFIKSKGTGLTMPLDTFSFDVDALPRLHVTFDTSLSEQPVDWRFGLLRASPEHPVAYGLRWPSSDVRPLDVVCRRMRTLDALEPFEPEWLGRTDSAILGE